MKQADGAPFLIGIADGAFDMQVIHPPYGVVNGRPEWLESIANRTSIEVPKELLTTLKARLIYAFYEQDSGLDAVPVDTVLLQPSQSPPRLMLPSGRFRLEFED